MKQKTELQIYILYTLNTVNQLFNEENKNTKRE